MKQIKRAFGLDRRRTARDDGNSNLPAESGPKATEDEGDPADRLVELLSGKRSPEEVDEIVSLVAKLAGEGERADGDPRDLGDDYEEDEVLSGNEREGRREAAAAGREDQTGSMRPDVLKLNRKSGIEGDKSGAQAAEIGRRDRRLEQDERPVQATSLRENLRRAARNLKGEPLGRRPAAGAMDASPVSFHDRFKNAGRFARGDVAYCQDGNGNSQFQPRPAMASDSGAASKQPFRERFPGSRRFA